MRASPPENVLRIASFRRRCEVPRLPGRGACTGTARGKCARGAEASQGCSSSREAGRGKHTGRRRKEEPGLTEDPEDNTGLGVAGVYSIQTLIQFSHTLSRGLLPGLVAVTHDHRNKPMTVDIIALRACTCASVALSILAEASLPELAAR